MLNPKAKRKKGKGKFHEMEMGPQKGPLHIEVFEAPMWMVLLSSNGSCERKAIRL